MYTCAHCGKEFESEWSDAEAHAEFDDAFPGADIGDAAVLCDDCYHKVMAR
jgi:DNA-directed RNA polymerase subunit RPC12/RpoP